MASPAHYAADPLAPAIALSARRRSTTQSLSGGRHAARDALRSTSFPSVKPRSSLRDQIGISHTGPLKQALRILAACLAGSAPCHVQMWRRAPGTIRRRGQPTERPLWGTVEAECWPPLQNGRVSMLLKFGLSLLL